MKIDEFKKELLWRFHITPAGEVQLDKLLQQLEPIVIEKEKIITQKKVIYKKFKKRPANINFDPLLKRICLIYKVEYIQCFCNNREKRVVAAKAHFCRQVKLDNCKTKISVLAKYLNCHYDTVRNLLYSNSIKCNLSPIVNK